jgi:hypothetical protein
LFNDEVNTDWLAVKMPEGPLHENLVIVRSGDKSLHRNWPKDLDESKRSWDLMLSHWDDGQPPTDNVDIVVRQGSSKFPAFARLRRDIPWFSSYKAVWMCDDDIMTSWSDIQHMFDLFHAYELDLAQPSLSANSYSSHRICYSCDDYLLRYTNFVEPMVPIFSEKAMAICVQTFDEGTHGFDLDWVWPKLLGYPVNKIAILDDAKVFHTRPVGSSAGYDYIHSLEEMFIEKKQSLLRKYEITKFDQLESGYILKHPREARSQCHISNLDQFRQLGGRLDPLLIAFAKTPISPAWRNHNHIWQFPQKWTGGAKRDYAIPTLAATDWCMSLGFTLCLKHAAKDDGKELIRIGGSETDFRLTLSYKTASDEEFLLLAALPSKQMKKIAFAINNLPIGQPLRFCMQFYAVAGWVRLWLNGEPMRDVWCDTVEWPNADRVWIGNEDASCEIDDFWLSPIPLAIGT